MHPTIVWLIIITMVTPQRGRVAGRGGGVTCYPGVGGRGWAWLSRRRATSTAWSGVRRRASMTLSRSPGPPPLYPPICGSADKSEAPAAGWVVGCERSEACSGDGLGAV